MNTRQQENGSVIVYILIAIALIAALSYAISHGSRSSEATLTKDQARIAANEIIEYGNAVAAAVQKLRLRGCKDTEISFANNIWKTVGGASIHPTGHNPNTPGDECEVFDSEGGAISALVMPSHDSLSLPSGSINKGHSVIDTIEVINVGSSAIDLVMIVNFVPREACPIINQLLGTFDSDTPPSDEWGGAVIFTGAYGGAAQIGDVETALRGKTSGCIEWTAGGYGDQDVHFYQVLIAR